MMVHSLGGEMLGVVDWVQMILQVAMVTSMITTGGRDLGDTTVLWQVRARIPIVHLRGTRHVISLLDIDIYFLFETNISLTLHQYRTCNMYKFLDPQPLKRIWRDHRAHTTPNQEYGSTQLKLSCQNTLLFTNALHQVLGLL